MDRRDTVSRLAVPLLLGLLSLAMPAAANEQLVLIVGARSELTPPGSAAVRRLFLGLTVTRESHALHPLLNESDPHIKEVFLQNVVSMSDLAYDRRILQLTNQEGRHPPPAYKDKERLIRSLAEDPDAVSYAWSRDVAADARVKVLRVLWSD